MGKRFKGKEVQSYLVNSQEKKLMFLKRENKQILGKRSLTTLVHSLQQPSYAVTKFVNTAWYLNENIHQSSTLACTQVHVPEGFKIQKEKKVTVTVRLTL